MHEMHRYDEGRTLPILYAAGLTTPQLAVLEFADTRKTVSVVAHYLGLSRPATSQLIDKLVRAGLVRRIQGAIDRRERHVILTARGGKLVGRIATARAARFSSSLAVISHPVAARLESALTEAIAELGAARQGPNRQSSAPPKLTLR